MPSDDRAVIVDDNRIDIAERLYADAQALIFLITRQELFARVIFCRF